MHGEYIVCPHCGNVREGEKIRRCESCSHVFCGTCAELASGGFIASLASAVLVGRAYCPKCEGYGKLLGAIKRG